MKQLVMMLLVCGVFACKKSSKSDDTPQPEPPPQGQPEIRPHGTPVGTAVKLRIGAAGGKIEGADSKIILEIPAGALTAEREISVQEVTNTLPGSPGKSFRLLPEDIKFARPVKLTFPYTDQMLLDTIRPEALFMAYQDKSGAGGL